jgi:phage-related protein
MTDQFPLKDIVFWRQAVEGHWRRGVLEVVESYDGGAYRAVHSVRFAERIYALHVFQKRSMKGIATPKHEIKKIALRLKMAKALHAEWISAEKDG